MQLAQFLVETSRTPDEVQTLAQRIHQQVRADSQHLRLPNFTTISAQDLRLLWQLYDEYFFGGAMARALGDSPLSFRLSRRLTSSAGSLKRRKHLGRFEFELSISVMILFQSFQGEQRSLTANGLVCRDRLEALQRVFEHELTHLCEFLVWTESSCSASRFQNLARRLFGHVAHTHQLMTQREIASTKYGLKCGDRVRFRFEGRHYEGRINRITRRATVLVEDPSGVRYTDGKKYLKFYMPLPALTPADAASTNGS